MPSYPSTLVPKGGAAAAAGLSVGDRLLKINDQSLLAMGHKAVVQLLQSTPPSLPLRLIVADANDVIKASLRRNMHPSGPSSAASSSPASPGVASLGMNGHSRGGGTFQFAVPAQQAPVVQSEVTRLVSLVLHNARTGTFLVVRPPNQVRRCGCSASSSPKPHGTLARFVLFTGRVRWRVGCWMFRNACHTTLLRIVSVHAPLDQRPLILALSAPRLAPPPSYLS